MPQFLVIFLNSKFLPLSQAHGRWTPQLVLNAGPNESSAQHCPQVTGQLSLGPDFMHKLLTRKVIPAMRAQVLEDLSWYIHDQLLPHAVGAFACVFVGAGLEFGTLVGGGVAALEGALDLVIPVVGTSDHLESL